MTAQIARARWGDAGAAVVSLVSPTFSEALVVTMVRGATGDDV